MLCCTVLCTALCCTALHFSHTECHSSATQGNKPKQPYTMTINAALPVKTKPTCKPVDED